MNQSPWGQNAAGVLIREAPANTWRPPQFEFTEDDAGGATLFSVVLENAVVTNDVAAVLLRVRYQDSVWRVTGSSKRLPEDLPDQNAGFLLALSRAMQRVTLQVTRQAQGRVKNNDWKRDEKKRRNQIKSEERLLKELAPESVKEFGMLQNLKPIPRDSEGHRLAWPDPNNAGGYIDAWNGAYDSLGDLLNEAAFWSAKESERVLAYGEGLIPEEEMERRIAKRKRPKQRERKRDKMKAN